MNYSPMDSVNALPQERINQSNEGIELTPDELRVLKECSRDAIVKRGLPTGIIFGLGGLMGARAGPLMSTKFGVKPAVIGLSLFGYFVGRMSYTRVCIDRVIALPDSNLRKFLEQKRTKKAYGDSADNYYVTVDPNQDAGFPGPSSSSDIDIPSTSSFDTTPSDYYHESIEAPKESLPQNYTSYDDLRKQNREDYSKRLYGETVKRSNPSEETVRRPPPPPPSSQFQPPGQSGGIKTKYGDVWDV